MPITSPTVRSSVLIQPLRTATASSPSPTQPTRVFPGLRLEQSPKDLPLQQTLTTHTHTNSHQDVSSSPSGTTIAQTVFTPSSASLSATPTTTVPPGPTSVPQPQTQAQPTETGNPSSEWPRMAPPCNYTTLARTPEPTRTV